PMSGNDPTDWYQRHGKTVAEQYEQLDFAEVHNWLLYLLPKPDGSVILDIGAGSGRDAAWLAERGHEVVAAEPTRALREEGQRRHPHPRIRWIDDRLPGLKATERLGLQFDMILVSAVWMHLPENRRARAFRKLTALLKPGGLLAITLRHGPADPERAMYPVSSEEIERLARAHGAFIEKREIGVPDTGGREGIHWDQLAIRLPDDGTGALPLIRHIVLNDAKSSTYKLALLRTLCRIAESADGLTRHNEDDTVSLPMGLVALVWARLYHPLIKGGFPQMPHTRDGRGLAFVKAPFQALLKHSALDLRIGTRFSPADSHAIHQALRDIRDTIIKQPVHYTTYPNGAQVLKATPFRLQRPQAGITLDEAYLWHFGELTVPARLWQALQRFSVWIEPAIITEWQRLIADYSERQGKPLNELALTQAMHWSDPERDVGLAREQALQLIEAGHPLHCVWSKKRLTPNNLDIDHCFPWSAWPCDDLWNLMPAHRATNNQKSARLPSAETFQAAEERIINWWEQGYCRESKPLLTERFHGEARATLPTPEPIRNDSLIQIFDAANLRRIRLRQDQQVPEWSQE
ncbi:class I SAM-dependent methyltransferase, partial [Gammaproteobacteria bacterium AB-CW1]|nr:class I SAM-dependent methyltransferase [Gammaproteobacteria bacterium AB-CW1]